VTRAARVRDTIRSPADTWLATRMGVWALALPLLKHVVTLPRLARLMWRPGSPQASARDVDRILTLSRWAARLRPLPGRGNCLEHSLLAYRYLSAAGASPRVVVGIRRDAGAMAGHVWLELDGAPVGESVDGFVPLLALGEHGRVDDLGGRLAQATRIARPA
jgi:hypothetical protein